ncbi:hypothetical protein QFC21_003965 [Naganishia friedmannii]|uniref:Uncharacterized protein n=1 Tax=Naganishia friedmannii TaxID=89922 RepID=A0ACC2VM17_9TREE|nr:hypothetical protein QFC21_003965 [Naganishia friedmannii]
MKVLGLLSGGKDSCYNLMHCIANGHEVVALATLVPEEGVGTSLVTLIAKALRLPLYQRTITGKPVHLESTYGSRTKERGSDRAKKDGIAGDETEDLDELLHQVKADFPDLQGVSTGAILSTYQRTRIEHVASRPSLGLTCLCYLWQRPEAELVDEMLASGLRAVIMKVAGLGLKVEDVGKELGAMRPKLARLEELYGSHVAGEGGEYETITIDCPLFHESIQIGLRWHRFSEEAETIVTDPSPVAYYRVKRATLQPKENHQVPTPAELREILRINIDGIEGMSKFDEQSEDLSAEIKEVSAPSQEVGDLQVSVPASCEAASVSFGRQGNWFSFSLESGIRGDEAIEEEVTRCFEQLNDSLLEKGLSLTQIQHQNFLLANMDDFPKANKAYSAFFGSSPPSRACVSVILPVNQRVRLEAMGYDDSKLPERSGLGRSALHVQSISYWAPANIGPYSQAVMAGHRLTIAGQIGLIPPTLSLPSPQSFTEEAVLSLQHVRRILAVLRSTSTAGGGWEGWVEGVICWYARSQDSVLAKSAWKAHAKTNGYSNTPITFIQVPQLPKGALVEWQFAVHTGRRVTPVIHDDEEIPVTFEHDQYDDAGFSGAIVESALGQSHFAVHTFESLGAIADGLEAADVPFASSLQRAFSVRVFYDASLAEEEVPTLRKTIKDKSTAAVTLIPVISTSGLKDERRPLCIIVYGQ